MPEPFKNNFSIPLVRSLAGMLQQQIPEFRTSHFVDFISEEFELLELKQRSERITEALCQFMPGDLGRCQQVIEAILHPDDIADFSEKSMALSDAENKGLQGWLVMPVADFVSRRWIEADFLTGLHLLKSLTRRFSAEFAIRDFILADQNKALEEIKSWLTDPNEHVRRLASEGSRTRLPWGRQLPMFIENPEPLRPVLESLMDDSSEYVRRSVANNLNDIAKDHPEFVIGFVEQHLSTGSTKRKKLFRHACRSLFKQGDKATLALFGYPQFDGKVDIVKVSEEVRWGGDLTFEIAISSESKLPQNLMLDFVIWHKKANGKQTPKVFKWKVIDGYMGDRLKITKRHSFKPVTTRKYYPGEHRIEFQINGIVVAERSFLLANN